MDTFINLYDFLRDYDGNLFEWLNEPWVGKDKQESLMRLFAGLNLIYKLDNYTVCNGNFNTMTLEKHEKYYDVFYHSGKVKALKDKGDSSDLTCIHKDKNKHLLLTTSKNINNLNIGKLDIDKILTNFNKYYGYTMTLCVCVRSIKAFNSMINNVECTNKELLSIVTKGDTILIDWFDLNQAFIRFKSTFKDRLLQDIISTGKPSLHLKPHQELSVINTIKLRNENIKDILWGHIQRSGKSYIIAGCILENDKNKNKSNYLIITTAPNETIEQQKNVFNKHLQFKDYNVVVLNGNNKSPPLSDKNIIICSKHFLQSKTDKTKTTIQWLHDMSFDMRFVDESHNGGTTEIAKNTLNYYGKDTFTVFITATFIKPANDYSIPVQHWVLWDLEDIKFCKNIDTCFEKLTHKHGDAFKRILMRYTIEHIKKEYSKYPDLCIFSNRIDDEIAEDIIERTRDNDYGWSTEGCFLLKNNDRKRLPEFQNEEEALKVFYRIFGKRDIYGIPDSEYPDDKVFIKRIEKICKDPDTKSRFIYDIDSEPTVILAFLPGEDINLRSEAITNLLEKHNVIPQFDIISLNSKITNDPRKYVEDAIKIAKNKNKKGVLVLSYRQCALGVSIPNCDIVLLLNNSNSYDSIYQMMFRSMTEDKDKRCGFVIDLNLRRVIEQTVAQYALITRSNTTIKEAIDYILQERLIILNADHWKYSERKLDTISNAVYKLYMSNTISVVTQLLNRLNLKKVLLSKDEQKFFNTLFDNRVNNKSEVKQAIDELNRSIKDGIEKTAMPNDTKQNGDEKQDEDVNLMGLIKHIIPLVCLLTVHHEQSSLEEMINIINQDEYILDILIQQIRTWWGRYMDKEVFNTLINTYLKHREGDDNNVIRTIKELFSKNINKSDELSKIIDKYLIPHELEKKVNAEVSTPYRLRQEMLDKIPTEFWLSPKKVLEPCAGKGGFVVDIVHRFMNGLKNTIPDEKERYRTIVEECIYFCDINSVNIFICKLLLDPYGDYKLQYYEGDTLKYEPPCLFDAVIGNPPYNGNLYKKFTMYCINISYYLLFVIPSNFTIGVSHKKFIDVLKFNGLKIVNYLKRQSWNTKIDIDTLYILCIKDYNGEISINNVPVDRDSKILNMDYDYLNILSKIKSYPSFKLLKGKNKTLVHNNPTETDTIKFKYSTEHCYPLLSRLNGGRKLQIYYVNEYQEKSNDKYKVLFPRGTGSYNSISKLKKIHEPIVYSYITNENILLSTGIVYVECEDLEESEFVQWYLMYSKLCRFLFIKENKFSELTVGFMSIIPQVDYKKIDKCNDTNIYKYFNLSSDDINKIEETVQSL